jgi:hypothetical protein
MGVDILITPVGDWQRMGDLYMDMQGGLERIMRQLQRQAAS